MCINLKIESISKEMTIKKQQILLFVFRNNLRV